MSRRRIAWGFGVNLFDRFIGLALQLALIPILATHWGLATYGGWAMLVTVPAVLVLSDLGFATVASVRMTMEVARGARDAAKVTMHSATKIVFFACAAMAILTSTALVLLPDAAFFDLPGTTLGELRATISFLTVYAALILVSGLVIGLFRSVSRFTVGSLLSTVTLCLENGFLILVVILGYGIAVGAFAMMAGRFVGLVISLGVAAWTSPDLLPGFSYAQAEVRREMLKPALAAMAIPLAWATLLHGQVIALGFSVGASAVPAFVAARTLSRIGMQGVQALTLPIMPEFGTAMAQENHRKVVRLFTLLTVASVIIAVLFSSVLAIAGPWIVLKWSHQTIAAPHSMMLAIAISALCGCIWNPLSNLILAINKQASFALVFVGAAIIGIVGTFALGPALGSTAPAVVLAIVDFVMLLSVLRFSLREFGSPSEWRRTAIEIASETVESIKRILQNRMSLQKRRNK